MALFALSALINAYASLVLGGLVILQTKNDHKRIAFAVFAFIVALWSFAYFFWLRAGSLEEANLWIRIVLMTASFIPFVYLHFVIAFLDELKAKFPVIIFGYTAALVFAYLSLSSDALIDSITPKMYFLFWPSAGTLFTFFLILWFGAFLYATYELVRAYFSASATKRIAIKYIVVGMLAGFAGGGTNFFLWYDIEIPPYGNIFVSLYVVAVAYAILRTNLFNVRLFYAEIFTVLIWLFALIRLGMAQGPAERMAEFLFLLGVIILGVFLLRAVRHEIESREQEHKLSNRLSRANARLRQLDELKTEFVSIASHQLRAPITAIAGFASLMREGSYGSVPEHLEVPIERIYVSGRRLGMVVEDFLNVTRIEQGRFTMEIDVHDLFVVVNSVVDEQKLIAEQKGISLDCSCGESSSLMVLADDEKLKQVLTNLVDNAIKYTAHGTVHIRVVRDDERGVAQVVVEDSGIGVSAQDLESLFEKFSRAKNANSENVQGTGLGLYVARMMMRKQGGDVELTSDGVGKGTRSTVTIPLARTNA